MTLTPLADRVLIKPTEQPTMTASGLHLSEDWKPEQTGTVIATGVCPHPRKDDAHELAQKLDTMALSAYPDFHKERIQAAATMLRGLTAREPEVQVGDVVIFSWNVGQEIWVADGEERYLLMFERDILAVIDIDTEPEAEPAHVHDLRAEVAALTAGFVEGENEAMQS